MYFYDENNNRIDNENIEKPEQDLADHYIINSDVVLELGARYGTVSCVINKKLINTKNQVVVEPDDRVWNALEKNKLNNDCNFHIVKGFISNKKLGLINHDYGYGTTFITDNTSSISSYTLNDIQNIYNLEFNVLVADCEGYLETFLDENPILYNNLRLIIFEADYSDKCNYDKIRQNLINNNFICKLQGFQNVYIKIPHNFNVDIYRLSLGNFSNEQCIQHYIDHGYRENREYK